jgi:hypothetical protein
MKHFSLLFTALLLAVSFSTLAAADENRGSKPFACLKVMWEFTPSQSVHVRLTKDDQALAQFTLNREDPVRQFCLSAETTTAEGRIRIRYKDSRGKAYLKMDKLTYRCYSPNERTFSGILAEFDLPRGDAPADE